MSSAKGDSRYTRRCDDDDVFDFECSSSSDESSCCSLQVKNDERAWARAYGAEIQALYDEFITAGRAIFGRAFHQFGGQREFRHYCWLQTQP